MPCKRNECQVSLTQFSESSGLKLLGRPILADLAARKNAWQLASAEIRVLEGLASSLVKQAAGSLRGRSFLIKGPKPSDYWSKFLGTTPTAQP